MPTRQGRLRLLLSYQPRIFFDKLKVPAALLSGTLVASGILQITELASFQISADIIDYCLLILGSSVGCRFADKSFGEIGRNALHSFVATFLLVVLGLIAALVASLLIDLSLIHI